MVDAVCASTVRRVVISVALVLTACARPVRAGGATEAVVSTTSDCFESAELEHKMRSKPTLARAVELAAEHRFQVLMSVPSPDGRGWDRREGFRVDAEYFYPASAIKPCIALAALEELAELRTSASSPEHGDPSELDARATFVSERRPGGASVAMLVAGSLVMSDNDASNDLLDLAGFDGFHERMWRQGLKSVHVLHRFGDAARDDVRVAPRIELMSPSSTDARYDVVVPSRQGTLTIPPSVVAGTRVGRSQFVGGRIVDEPMSFADKNRVSLVDLQNLMVGLMRPDLRDTELLPAIGEKEQGVLVDALTRLPSAQGLPKSTDVKHKPLLAGFERVLPRSRLLVASKSGRAYGFLVDNAYVTDVKTGRAFFLTVAFYGNENGCLNDDLYEYTLAYSVLADVGELVAQSVFADSDLASSSRRLSGP
jgi:hypothetical protein